MILSLRTLRVYACAVPVDMRKGHDGLAGLVITHFGMDVMDGAMFVFLARRRQSAKVLLWDGTGLVVIHKRLERGRFANIFSENNSVVTLTTSELSLLLEGTKFSPPLSCPEYFLDNEHRTNPERDRHQLPPYRMRDAVQLQRHVERHAEQVS